MSGGRLSGSSTVPPRSSLAIAAARRCQLGPPSGGGRAACSPGEREQDSAVGAEQWRGRAKHGAAMREKHNARAGQGRLEGRAKQRQTKAAPEQGRVRAQHSSAPRPDSPTLCAAGGLLHDEKRAAVFRIVNHLEELDAVRVGQVLHDGNLALVHISQLDLRVGPPQRPPPRHRARDDLDGHFQPIGAGALPGQVAGY
eukprot:scaffold24729_cov117-Isochrysis_galbana.AAC.1